MISSLPSPSRSCSTGDAVAPRARWRVNGSCGRGMGGVIAPRLSAFGVHVVWRLPLSLKTYTVPVVVVTTTFRKPVALEVADGDVAHDRLVARVDPRVRLGHHRRVGVRGPPRQLGARLRVEGVHPAVGVAEHDGQATRALQVDERGLALAAPTDALGEAGLPRAVVMHGDRAPLLAHPAGRVGDPDPEGDRVLLGGLERLGRRKRVRRVPERRRDRAQVDRSERAVERRAARARAGGDERGVGRLRARRELQLPGVAR